MDPLLLEKIGLTHNESIVYLSLLKIGTSKTGKILKSASINSGKIYEILESLKVKGLASESIINNVRYFTAASPSQILDYLEKKKEEINREEGLIKREMPNLKILQKIDIDEVKAVTYLGLRGIKTAADEALERLDNNDEILGMGITSKKDERFNEFWINWTKKRIRLKPRIKAKHIYSEKSDYYKSFKKVSKSIQSKFLEGLTPVTVDIFGKESVLILNYNEPVSCILIHDKNTNTAFRTFFYQLWKIAKK